MEEYKGKIKTDTLQRLHTVANLQVSARSSEIHDSNQNLYHDSQYTMELMQELLSAGHELEPTLRDDNLPGEAEELKAKYLSKYKTAVVAAQESVGPILKSQEL